mmetsp:Transcript_102679/g.299530  ORF Transcript_102679/g.299530 Transcript_102679/m.299530 type:complete len:236 (+) Transcript_102679:543-1250(+)
MCPPLLWRGIPPPSHQLVVHLLPSAARIPESWRLRYCAAPARQPHPTRLSPPWRGSEGPPDRPGRLQVALPRPTPGTQGPGSPIHKDCPHNGVEAGWRSWASPLALAAELALSRSTTRSWRGRLTFEIPCHRLTVLPPVQQETSASSAVRPARADLQSPRRPRRAGTASAAARNARGCRGRCRRRGPSWVPGGLRQRSRRPLRRAARRRTCRCPPGASRSRSRSRTWGSASCSRP